VRASTSLDNSGLELNRAGQVVVQPKSLTKSDSSIFALGDCATFVPAGSDRPLPPTAQVANQQALHLIHHLPAWLQEGKPVPSFRFRDLGALVALSVARRSSAIERRASVSRPMSRGANARDASRKLDRTRTFR